MNLQKIIAELESERDRLDQAILALERLSASNVKRRGRPPRWLRDSDALSPADAGSASAEEARIPSIS